MHLYTILWEIYRVVRGKRLEIHSTKVYNMLRAVMILQSILFELIAVHLREALSGKFLVQAS